MFRCDLADFPQRLRLAAEFHGQWAGTLRTGSRSLDLRRVRSAYYRRPSPPELPAGMSDTEQQWAATEARAALDGLLAAVPDWLNHPSRLEHAEHKPVQLAAAAAVGLTTPRTLITNDPASAADFVGRVGRAVYKPFSSTVRSEAGKQFVYTTVVTPSDLAGAGVEHTAHLFQEWVDKDHEVRLTVVDDQFFAARLLGTSARAQMDWRSDYDSIEYAVTEPPPPVGTAVRRMLEHLGLRFAAMDFVVRPDGRWVFLDLNPNGQWGWIENETGLPICTAIADALTRPLPQLPT